jgi:hypothetical protein
MYVVSSAGASAFVYSLHRSLKRTTVRVLPVIALMYAA